MPNKKIVLILTKWCNLECTYCYEKEFNSNIKLMTLDTFKKIIKSFKSKVDIELFWWESLLNQIIINYIIDNYQNINIDKVKISTNWLLIDDKLIQFYNTHLWKITFIISIDWDKNSHDYYRVDKKGNWTYEKILKNIIKIENKDFIEINICITPFSSKSFHLGIIELIKLWLIHFKTIIIYEYNWSNETIMFLLNSLKILKQIKEKSSIFFPLFEWNNLFETSKDCKEDMESKYRFNYNWDLIPCTLYLSEFSEKIDVELWNINDKKFDLNKKFHNTIDFFHKNKKYSSTICDLYSNNTYKKNKFKINTLIGKKV
jgi:sulfatase maturation enzyme AslB (radical SAM superfamily)